MSGYSTQSLQVLLIAFASGLGVTALVTCQVQHLHNTDTFLFFKRRLFLLGQSITSILNHLSKMIPNNDDDNKKRERKKGGNYTTAKPMFYFLYIIIVVVIDEREQDLIGQCRHNQVVVEK